MNHQPPSLKRLYELLEVLRPDFNEKGEVFGHLAAELVQRLEHGELLSDEQARRLKESDAREELAELLEKYPHLIETWHEIARVDDLLREAVQDVVVPEGLQLRLLESIHNQKSSLQKPHSQEPEPSSVLPRVRRWNQMRSVALVIAASLLVVASVAWWFASNGSSNWSENQILTVASSGFAQESSPSAKSLSMSLSEEDRAILQKYVPSEDVVQPSAATWEVVDDFLGRRAVVYRFEDRHGNRAALFVVRQDQSVPGLIDRPPHRPQLMTAGRTAGAWQSDGLLYILVSSGGENAWRSFLVPERPVT